jgi:succinate dehydrogenase / fumarate reductase, flavoprotein subunit
MERYAPHAKDLASRDVVSPRDDHRDSRGPRHGPKKDHIHLHLAPRPEDHPRAPARHLRTARIFAGVDVTREPIPVLPTVHYNMGGIPTNYHGEVLTKVDGDPDGGPRPDGGRRGGVRVGARRQPARLQLADRPRRLRPRGAAHALPRDDEPTRSTRPAQGRRRGAVARLDRFRHASGGTPTAELRRRMQKVMQENCAVFRTGEVLPKATSASTRSGAAARRPRHRPLADLEHRPDRDARVRQPDRAGGDTMDSAATAPSRAAPTRARTIPSATTRTG